MKMNKKDIRNLKKRYLVWCYKTTKDALDKIERKFTQSAIDRFILKELKKDQKVKGIGRFISNFEAYIDNKEKDGFKLKFEGRKLKPDYLFWALKLEAVEKAIIKELGKAGLDEIKSLYEEEMTERILKSTEH
ncbi:MAG: hypothetical protein WC301_06770 [Candidatus Omnitrophota bacterium]|jgi:hypothetical protein